MANFTIRRNEIPPTYIKVEFLDDVLGSAKHSLVRVTGSDINHILPAGEGRQKSGDREKTRQLIRPIF